MKYSDHGWSQTVTQLLVTTCILLVARFCWKMYKARIVFHRLRKLGMPMPPWNPILGHLAVLPPLLKQFPKGTPQSYMFGVLAQQFKDSDGLFFIDVWPFSAPMIVVSAPDLAYQVCQEFDLPKPDTLAYFFKPIVGGLGLFMMNGAEHKSSRALFNPGFGANVILEHTKHIVEQAEVFVEILREHARKGDMFALDDLTCWYMMDVIGAVTLNARLNSLRSDNALASAMRRQIDQHVREEELNPFIRYNPLYPLKVWYNGRKMDQYISAELDKRYQEWRNSSISVKTKSVIDLALADYMRDRKANETLDLEFRSWACAQIRLFLFVGHDSTAATIVYCLYLLSKHPEAMERIRKEHDDVFGGEISKAPQLLKDHSQLINQLPFTTAVIKETLRLFPPAAAFRGGLPGVSLRNPKGSEKYPTEGCGIWVMHNAIHRNPEYWPEPAKFLPERWLVGPEDPLYPPKWGWRPFEYGSRNCVGQTLVMLDIKVTLVMVIREFDVKDAYDEWDRLNGTTGIKTMDGERAYQVARGSDHPVNGFPCRVMMRQQL